MPSLETLFEQWLSGNLSVEEQKKVEHLLMQDAEYCKRLATAKAIEHQTELYVEEPVPAWNRETTFEVEHRAWWQWQGMAALSMAFSCCALALVLFKVELQINDQGLLVSFAGNTQQAETMQLVQQVDAKLASFEQQQQLALANFKAKISADVSAGQQTANLQLASYILDTSRQERKEDISDFVSYINAQRKDDRQEQYLKNQQLEDAILLQSQFLNNSTTRLQQANWLSDQ